ncbi:Ctr-domain-containing protein [Daldinia sp. FL1419]|nr:Ctr-domain-containing protein [Daldinia sp. FL1419]
MDAMSMPSSTELAASLYAVKSTIGPAIPTATSTIEGTDSMGDMGSMGSAGSREGGCKISMLWNWDTIDVCFLSESWQIKSRGGFAGLCIGVVLLVVLLEFLRRTARIYDQYLIRQHLRTTSIITDNSSDTADGAFIAKRNATALVRDTPFRPKFWQQAIRAFLHTLQFAVAYWIMLLAMYYNGYVIICIIIGAFIGFFILQWERLGPRGGGVTFDDGKDTTGCHG